MTIYDKSDIDNVSDSYLRSLVQEIMETKISNNNNKI